MRCYSGNYPLSHETGKIVSLLEIENWSWSSALLKSSVWKVPVPNELSWLLRYGRLFGRLISVLKWKGSHKCFIKVRISSYNFSLKSNQLRPWILETENLSVYGCVLYWIFRLIWAQCNFLSRQTRWMIPSEKFNTEETITFNTQQRNGKPEKIQACWPSLTFAIPLQCSLTNRLSD